MSRTISLIQRVQIASPCTASWDQMQGDDKSRFCAQCKLNVYNLSAMTEDEAERLIIEKEGRLCARIYRRRDGTVLTRDCPVGLAAVQRRMIAHGLRVASAIACVLGALAYAIGQDPSREDNLSGASGPQMTAFAKANVVVKRWMTTDAPTYIRMGKPQWEAGAMVVSPRDEQSNSADH